MSAETETQLPFQKELAHTREELQWGSVIRMLSAHWSLVWVRESREEKTRQRYCWLSLTVGRMQDKESAGWTHAKESVLGYKLSDPLGGTR